MVGHRILVVVLTADLLAGKQGRALEAGCSAYLRKPFDPAELQDVVAPVLRQEA